MKPAQETPFDPKRTLPTGQQNLKYIVWNMPDSNCQIFIPANYTILQGPINIVSHCALKPSTEANCNKSVCTQQQTTAAAAGPNSSQQFSAKTSINTKSLNGTQRGVNPSMLCRRQQPANAIKKLPKSQLKKRMTLPSDSQYLATERAPREHGSSIGGRICLKLSTEHSSTRANLQALSTCEQDPQQNNTAQNAVAGVTSLSPIVTPPVHVSYKSTQVMLRHQPDIPHPLKANVNLQATEEPSELTSKHQQAVSGEPRQDGGLCNAAGTKSPVWTYESTSQSNCANSPMLNSATQTKAALSNQIPDEASEVMSNDNHALTNKKTNVEETDRCSPFPVTDWPLGKLQTFVDFLEEIDKRRQININKTCAGKEILELFWNGDVCMFHNAVKSGTYQSIMEEVYSHCSKDDHVILKQIKNDARNRVADEFHILEHDEAPPKMAYESSWMNLNEELDDIDREFGYSWYFKSLNSISQETVQHKEGTTDNLKSRSLDKPSLMRHSQCPTETVADDERALLNAKEKNVHNENLCENVPNSANDPSPVTSDNRSPKQTVVVAEQTSCQPNVVNPLEDLTTGTGTSGNPKLIDRFLNNFGAGSSVSPEPSSQNGCSSLPTLNPVVAEKQKFVTSSQGQTGSNETITNSDRAVTDKRVSEIVSKPSEEVALEINKIDEMNTSTASVKMNSSPSETSSIISVTMNCLDEESHVSAAPLKMMHKPPCLETPQILEEEQVNMDGFEEKAKNSAPTIQNASLGTSSKRLITRHDQCMTQIVNKVPAKQKTCLELKETGLDNREHHKNLPVSFKDHSLVKLTWLSKPDYVFTEQTKCQPNTVNHPQAITNLVKDSKDRVKMDEQDVSITNHQRSTAGTPEKPRLDERFCNQVKTKSPRLTNESTCPSLPNTVAGKQQEVVSSSPVVNKSEVKNSAHTTQSTNLDPPCEPLQTGPQSTTESVSKVPAEVKETNLENENYSLLKKTSVFAQIQTEDNRSLKPNTVLTEQSHCQPDVANQYLTETSGKTVIHDTFCNGGGGRSPKLIDKSPAQSDFVRSPKVSLVAAEQHEVISPSQKPNDTNKKAPNSSKTDKTIPNTSQDDTYEPVEQQAPHELKENGSEILQECLASSPKQNESNEKAPNDDCAIARENPSCKTVPKPSTTIPLPIDTEFDDIASVRIKVVPYEIAQQWFAGDDIKPKERKNLGAVDVKLKSYCCLAKWVQALKYAEASSCMCRVKAELKNRDVKAHDFSSERQTNEKKCVKFSTDSGCTESEPTERMNEDASECTETNASSMSHTDTANSDAVEKLNIVKDCSLSKEGFKAEKAALERKNNELPSKCAKIMSLEQYKKDTPSSDGKRTKTLCLLLYGSSSNTSDGEQRNKRYKNGCEEPPESLEITISCRENTEWRRNSRKRKWDGSMENEDALDRRWKKTSLKTSDGSRGPPLHDVTPTKVSEVTKENALSSTLPIKKGKIKKIRFGMQQISMNKFIMRRKTKPSKSFQSSETVMRDKYDLGSPALMPLQEGVGLEFRVLPLSFNFGTEAQLHHIQADTSGGQKEMSYPEDKAKRMETSHALTRGGWCFSPLKTKHIHSADVSGPCSTFQEFRKRYQETKRKMASGRT